MRSSAGVAGDGRARRRRARRSRPARSRSSSAFDASGGSTGRIAAPFRAGLPRIVTIGRPDRRFSKDIGGVGTSSSPPDRRSIRQIVQLRQNRHGPATSRSGTDSRRGLRRRPSDDAVRPESRQIRHDRPRLADTVDPDGWPAPIAGASPSRSVGAEPLAALLLPARRRRRSPTGSAGAPTAGPAIADSGARRPSPRPIATPDACRRPGPDVLNRPIEPGRRRPPATRRRCRTIARPVADPDPPLGFTGPTGVAAAASRPTRDFVPVEDRWRIGFPAWDRYGKGHPPLDDYPYDARPAGSTRTTRTSSRATTRSSASTPSSNVTGITVALVRGPADADRRRRRSRAPPGRASSSSSAGPNQFFYTQFFSLSFDLFHGDAAFKPVDWRVKVTPVFNVNNLSVEELAVVSPDVHARAPRATGPCSTLAGVVRRDEAGRPQPELRLRLGPGRLAAVRQRLPRLHLQRHQPRPSGCSAPATPTATSSTSSTSASSRRTPTAA